LRNRVRCAGQLLASGLDALKRLRRGCERAGLFAACSVALFASEERLRRARARRRPPHFRTPENSYNRCGLSLWIHSARSVSSSVVVLDVCRREWLLADGWA